MIYENCTELSAIFVKKCTELSALSLFFAPTWRKPDLLGNSALQLVVFKDDIETGYGNIIPLWMFGMLY